MDSLDGYLQVPPERSQILGRQSWKTRYITIGPPQPAAARERAHSTANRTNSFPSNSVNKDATDDIYLSVFKAKDDWEPFQRWLLSHVCDCQVQLLSHRKQGPVLPTLVVTISDSQRKRRSSRATGFMSSNKDSGVTALWFRTPPDDHHPSLHLWAQYIMAKKGEASTVGCPLSPALISPFHARSHDNSDYSPRPGSGNRGLHHKRSTATYSTSPLDRPATFRSDSPSLRSKRSDLSSPCSNNFPSQKVPYAIPEQNYTTILPGDIVSSGSEGEDRGQFIIGWTSAQGRVSTVGSPVRSRDSISLQSQHCSIVDVASPPAPGETILDRAFQLGHIPGARSYVTGQEKLSSIARFDALMRESENKGRKRETTQRVQQGAMRSASDYDDDSLDDENEDDEESNKYSDSTIFSGTGNWDQFDFNAPLMSPSAQRALAFITGDDRNREDRSSKSHRPSMSRTHLSFHAGMSQPPKLAPSLRPHTAHDKSKHNAASGAKNSPHFIPTDTTSLDLPSCSKNQDHVHATNTATTTDNKRHSNSSSTKRLSFTEFTKRLSSTSNLLLAQTNASAGSSHVSSETDMQNSPSARKTLRGSAPPRPREREDQEGRCRWRNSIGVVAPEGGGFL